MNRVNENNCRSKKSQGERGYRKVKCAISQALVMINLYVMFNVHSSYVKQVIVLKIGEQTDGRTDGRTDEQTDGRTRLMTTIGICQNLFGIDLDYLTMTSVINLVPARVLQQFNMILNGLR